MSTATRIGIIGGGPAGIATALRLRAHGFDDITVLEAGDYTADKIGETLQPPCQGVLQKLGLWTSFLEDKHWEASLSGAAWGLAEVQFNDFMYRPIGRGWHLNRAKFEHRLGQVAEQRGIAVRKNTRFGQATRSAAGWALEVREAGKATETLGCDWVVDASGRKAVFARTQGARPVHYDELFGCYQFFSVPEGQGELAGHTLVESVPDGWWYSAQLPDARFVAAFMTDGETVRSLRLHQDEGLQRAVAGSAHTAARLQRLHPVGQPVVTTATSCLLDSLHGEGWLAVGDTAVAFDPLSSMGIYQALQGGISAGDAIRAHAQGDEPAVARYAEGLRQFFHQYLEIKAGFYRKEPRWPQHRFWASRQQAVPAGV
jgi:2-polyprenyl-6-methoxyphenol hydroxylase-like FAD-dependent oxidoreductase